MSRVSDSVIICSTMRFKGVIHRYRRLESRSMEAGKPELGTGGCCEEGEESNDEEKGGKGGKM